MGNHDILQDAFRARPTQHPVSLVDGSEQWKFSSNGIFNPLTTQKNVTVQHRGIEAFGNVYLDVTPIDNLSLKTIFLRICALVLLVVSGILGRKLCKEPKSLLLTK